MKKLTKNQFVEAVNNLFNRFTEYKLEINEDKNSFKYKVSKSYELEYDNALNEDREHRRWLMLETYKKWIKKYD